VSALLPAFSFYPTIPCNISRFCLDIFRETPVLKGEDAFNFEMRRLEVEHMSKEQRAENRRKLDERIANAKNKIEWCW